MHPRQSPGIRGQGEEATAWHRKMVLSSRDLQTGRGSVHRSWHRKPRPPRALLKVREKLFCFRVSSNCLLENPLSEILIQKLWGKQLLPDDSSLGDRGEPHFQKVKTPAIPISKHSLSISGVASTRLRAGQATKHKARGR